MKPSSTDNKQSQVSVNWKKKKKDSAPNDGSVAIAVLVFFGLIFLLAGFPLFHDTGGDAQQEQLEKVLLAIGCGFLGIALLIRILNHKKIALRKQRQNAYKSLPFNPQSQWDMKIKTNYEMRDRQLKIFVPLGTVTFFGAIFLLCIAAWWLSKKAGVPFSIIYALELVNADNPPPFYIQALLGVPCLLLVTGFILLGIAAVISVIYSRPYTKDHYKQTFVLPALTNTFTNVNFNPPQGLNTDWLSYVGVLLPFNGQYAPPIRPTTVSLLGVPLVIPVNQSDYVSTSNDFLSGNYRSIAFSQSDVTIRAKLKKGEDVPYTVLFSGRWLVVQSPKPVNSTFYVWGNQFEYSGMPQAVERGLQPVQLEDERFNTLFTVYAENPHDVFYIMTPPIIENLKNLVLDNEGKELFHGVAICCQGAEMHLLVSKVEDAFEPDLLYVMTENMAREKVAAEIGLITDMIDSVLSAKYN